MELLKINKHTSCSDTGGSMRSKSITIVFTVVVCLFVILSCQDNGSMTGSLSEVTEVLVDTTDLSIPDSITALYALPVYQIALSVFKGNARPDSDSVFIPADLVDSIDRVLRIMYHAAGLPARDSVVVLYPTLSHGYIDLSILNIDLDTTCAWAKSLLSDSLVTDSAMQDIMERYDLHAGLATVGRYGVEWILHADSFLNIYALAQEIELCVEGVNHTYFPPMIGDRSSVGFIRHSGFWSVSYTLRWGDCPSGCLYAHEWEFEVYDNGLVRFISSAGSSLSTYPT
jgi:hypothetical protein